MRWLLLSGVFLACSLTAMEIGETGKDTDSDSEQDGEVCPQDVTVNVSAVGGYVNLRELYIQVYGEKNGPQKCLDDFCAPVGVAQRLWLLRNQLTDKHQLEAIEKILMVF